MIIKRCPVCNSVIPHSQICCRTCKFLLEEEMLDSFFVRCPLCFYPSLGPEYECINCHHENSMPIYSLMDYSSEYSKLLIENFKFKGNKEISHLIAYYLSKCIDVLDPDRQAIIVSVPCSAISLKKRGWDQMSLVVKYIKRKSVKAVINTCTSLVQQKTLSKVQRAEFVSNIYALNPKLSIKDYEDLKTHKVIIVDDILTTGSTVYAVASVLRKANITNLSAATWLCEL